MKAKELTPTQSYYIVKDLLKSKRTFRDEDFKPGKLLFYFYNAKDKENTYDRTPMVLILKRNSTHTLGLNFHWIPVKMRIHLISVIFKLNKQNIIKKLPLEFSYQQLKPMMRKLGYAPCIRLYINKRISTNGVIIPADRLVEVAGLKTETFTHGKYSAEQMYAMARKRSLKKN